jgi:hypothetical protein
MLRQDDYFKSLLIQTAWRFTHQYGGHMAGQGVMHVLANRVRCGWGNWFQVIDGVPNFMAESELPPLKHPSVWEPGFVKMLHAVDGIFDGSLPDMNKSKITGQSALYWGDLKKIERPWFKEHIIDALDVTTGMRQHPIVGNQGTLTFFR